jgi:hypothetical protein
MLLLAAAGRPWVPATYIYSGSSWSSRKLSRPSRGGVLQSQTWTCLLLLLAGRVVVALQGYGGRLWTAESALSVFACPREGDRPKPRTCEALTIVLFVNTVPRFEESSGPHVVETRPGASRREVLVRGWSVVGQNLELSR